MVAKLPRREREILDLLYRLGECSAHDVRARLSDPPSYSAVRALLAKLVDKGLVRHRSEGNRYLYTPTEEQSRAGRSALEHLVRTFFQGSPVRAANALLGMETDPPDDEELKRLRRLVRELERQEADHD